jgi:hypothetical protein
LNVLVRLVPNGTGCKPGAMDPHSPHPEEPLRGCSG